MKAEVLGMPVGQAVLVTAATQERKLPEGWTEASPGGLATNPDLLTGGIIDRTIVDGTWFVVFHREDLKLLEGLPSRDIAFDAFREAMNGR
ncbi:hypothetical protein ACUXQ2_006251 [Cupriavidus metallidurans]|uniref:hypothetical protein n=1 Tax=Cupriavidus metallidurans TaxID=119219 RepID=UPI000B083006|nr:hypothetical protein [Cupriavidus metallidurans]